MGYPRSRVASLRNRPDAQRHGSPRIGSERRAHFFLSPLGCFRWRPQSSRSHDTNPGSSWALWQYPDRGGWQRMAFVGCREDGPSPHDLILARNGEKATQDLSGASVDRPVFDFRWTKDGGLLALVEDGFHTKFVAFAAEGARKDVPSMPANPNAFSVSDSGEV